MLFVVIFGHSIDVFRLWLGPLPNAICHIESLVKQTTFSNSMFIITVSISLRFYFTCIWKNLRQMMDSLLYTLVIRIGFLISLLYSLADSLGPGQQSWHFILCNGSYSDWKLPLFMKLSDFQALLCNLISIILTVIIFLKKHCSNKGEGTSSGQLHQQPKNLESLSLNMTLAVFVGGSACVCVFLMQK